MGKVLTFLLTFCFYLSRSGMFHFMFENAPKRDVVYHPESAYWVNYDIDLPLFLPVYAFNRVKDLRYIAEQQRTRGISVLGQNVFDSGWEWGYWIQDVAASG